MTRRRGRGAPLLTPYYPPLLTPPPTRHSLLHLLLTTPYHSLPLLTTHYSSYDSPLLASLDKRLKPLSRGGRVHGHVLEGGHRLRLKSLETDEPL